MQIADAAACLAFGAGEAIAASGLPEQFLLQILETAESG